VRVQAYTIFDGSCARLSLMPCVFVPNRCECFARFRLRSCSSLLAGSTGSQRNTSTPRDQRCPLAGLLIPDSRLATCSIPRQLFQGTAARSVGAYCLANVLPCALTAETGLRHEQGGDARRVHGSGENQDQYCHTQHEAVWLHPRLGQQYYSAAFLRCDSTHILLACPLPPPPAPWGQGAGC